MAFIGVVNLMSLGSLGDLSMKISTAEAAATSAAAAAANARQMVLNRDPAINAATQAVQTLPTTLQQAAAEHQVLQANIDAERAARTAADNALQALIDMLAARPTSAYRKKAATATLTLAIGNVDVPVTWDTPMPDAEYACWPVLTGTGGLAAIDPPVVKSQTKTGCVITIRSRLALAATVTFTAQALRVA